MGGSLDGAPSWYWQVYADDEGPFVFPLPSIVVAPVGASLTQSAGRLASWSPSDRALAASFAASCAGALLLLVGSCWLALFLGLVAVVFAVFALRVALAAQRRLAGFSHVYFFLYSRFLPGFVRRLVASVGRGRFFNLATNMSDL